MCTVDRPAECDVLRLALEEANTCYQWAEDGRVKAEAILDDVYPVLAACGRLLAAEQMANRSDEQWIESRPLVEAVRAVIQATQRLVEVDHGALVPLREPGGTGRETGAGRSNNGCLAKLPGSLRPAEEGEEARRVSSGLPRVGSISGSRDSSSRAIPTNGVSTGAGSR